MFGSFILDVAVSMVFIYLLLSLVASGINEILASIVQSRAANLERGLKSLFSGNSIEAGAKLVDNIYDHGLIRGLYPDPERDLNDNSPLGKWTRLRLWLQKFVGMASGGTVAGIKNRLLLPSYIPARTFALAMLDILNKDKFNGKLPIKNIEAFLSSHHQQFGDNKAVQALLTLLADAKNDGSTDEERLQKFQKNLENWYNDAMDRVAGWYKRYTQRVLLTVGFVLAFAFNVNSIHIAHVLWVDRDVRSGMASAATDYWNRHQSTAAAEQPVKAAPGKDAADPGGQTSGETNPEGTTTGAAAAGQANSDGQKKSEAELASDLRSSVQAFHDISAKYLFPVGWQHRPADYETWWRKDWRGMSFNALITLVGWLITAGALSLGASFWFDMLNKIMVIRNTVKPQEKSPPEASKD
ncbi:MAG: hypothetical protein JO300_09770 [Silvibacterium sp.]|nr:hypothetical protein [Silvibacterium sp.]MBV8436551.1 hypothetical protein [Silvibacterium sp.]